MSIASTEIARPRRGRLYIVVGAILAVLAFATAAGLASLSLLPSNTGGTRVVVAKNNITARTRIQAADLELKSFNPDTAFLLPIVIDDTSIDNPELPPQFRAVQWKPLPGGVPTGDFVERVRQLYRRHQAALAGLA